LCALVVPVVLGAAWTTYTDAVKGANALGRQLTSAVLREWNFGTLAQRLDPVTYLSVFWTRVASTNIGGWLGIALIAGAIAAPTSPGLRRTVVICLALFVAPVLVFTNLHVVHDYYQTSCALFLIAALAIAVSEWVPSITGRTALVPGLMILLVSANLTAFVIGYGKVARTAISIPGNRTLAIADVLRRSTPAGSAFVAFGLDWSSEVSYYAERKSFSVPEWFSDYPHAWERPADYLGDTPLGAMVVCPGNRPPTIADAERKAQIDAHWTVLPVQDCRVLINSAADPSTAVTELGGSGYSVQ
jgi:hypothetical protein